MSAIDNGDYGFLVSQLGFDVTRAADYQMLMSSGWPNLKIEHTESVTIPNAGNFTYTHGLGYPAFWLVWVNDGTRTYLATPSPGTMTSTSLSIDNFSGTTLTYRVYIYRLPLNATFTAPNYSLTPVTATAQDKNLGIKVMKAGKKYSSTDLRDYNFHSGTRSPMLHAVVQGQAQSNGSFYEIDYTNTLTYVPMFFGFVSITGASWTAMFGGEQSPPQLTMQSTGDASIRTGTVGAPPASNPQRYASILIFKDPFAPSAVQAVTY